MTREEKIALLIDELEDIRCDNFDADTDEDKTLKEVVRVIKALEQEPCEDCISREEVCDYIAEFVNHEYATDRERELVKNIIDGIQHLPSIQPTAKENLVVGDCISRKALIEYANNLKDGIGITANDIARFPSIQPKTDVLDKIRAEIKEVQTYKMFEGEDTVYVERKDVLAIIEKYKAEKE